jgi:nicotinamidase/pyrazinamidase
MKKETLVFVDVDTQRDFLNPDGALYVPGSEEIKPNLKKLTQFARDNDIQVYKTMDTHTEESKELERNGGVYPDHCIVDTVGQKSIVETIPKNGKKQPNTGIFYKDCPDAYDKALGAKFYGTSMRKVIKAFKEAVVYGVCTNICVLMQVRGLIKAGLEVYVIHDACKAIEVDGVPTEQEAVLEMTKAGAYFFDTDKIIEVITNEL